MQSRHLLNLVMLLFVVALAVAAWFVYHDKNAPKYLSSLPATQVNSIVITREHGDIVLSRADTIWRMQKPYALPAHDFRVQSLLSLLSAPAEQSYNLDDLDPMQFGLKPARASIRFNDSEIKFGKSNPVNNKRYLLSNNRIYLLNDTLYPLVSAEAASLISLSLLEPGMVIEKISLPKLGMEKSMDNLWHDQTGKAIAADNAQQLLDYWRDATAYAAHTYMQRSNAQTISIVLEDKTTIFFLAAQDNNSLIIGRPDAGVEYHLDGQYTKQLLQLPVDDSQTSHSQPAVH